MRTSLRNLAWAALLGSSSSLACSCYGPQTFCGVLHPPYPNPEWWIPDAVVLGVKLGDIAHGMDVKVVTVFSGSVQENDTLRVWGDTGLNCRVYAETWAAGDTVVWALQWTDFAGGSMEQEGDYLISVCGTYWLEYANGIVSGALLEEGVIESVPIDQFVAFVAGCLTTTVAEGAGEDPLIVRADGGALWLSMITRQRAQLSIVDALGRDLISRDWDGSPVQFSGMAPGAYLVLVDVGERRWGRKVALY